MSPMWRPLRSTFRPLSKQQAKYNSYAADKYPVRGIKKDPHHKKECNK